MKSKDLIMMIAAIVAFLVGIGLTVAGFCVPPVGVISGSVLTALGEFLTFFASVFGIGKFTEIQIEKIKNTNKEKGAE
jgi:hypothetical protein